MKIQVERETLRISEVKELGAANADEFRDQARASLTHDLKAVDIDLSQTTFLDSCGLGALISLHKTMRERSGVVRLMHPSPGVLQILELTRMQRVFEIVKS